MSCELLSDFVYSFFEHNADPAGGDGDNVVNCFQILYIRSLNTMVWFVARREDVLWIAFRFCIFVLWTQSREILAPRATRCELLSDFVYSFFEHNGHQDGRDHGVLWIAFRFCIFVLWTQCFTRINVSEASCELLSDFVYSFFEHNCSASRWLLR